MDVSGAEAGVSLRALSVQAPIFRTAIQTTWHPSHRRNPQDCREAAVRSERATSARARARPKQPNKKRTSSARPEPGRPASDSVEGKFPPPSARDRADRVAQRAQSLLGSRLEPGLHGIGRATDRLLRWPLPREYIDARSNQRVSISIQWLLLMYMKDSFIILWHFLTPNHGSLRRQGRSCFVLAVQKHIL